MFDVSKVDAAIERIADGICKNNATYSFEEMQINAQMTTALAELIKARAVIVKRKCYTQGESIINPLTKD